MPSEEKRNQTMICSQAANLFFSFNDSDLLCHQGLTQGLLRAADNFFFFLNLLSNYAPESNSLNHLIMQMSIWPNDTAKSSSHTNLNHCDLVPLTLLLENFKAVCSSTGSSGKTDRQ